MTAKNNAEAYSLITDFFKKLDTANISGSYAGLRNHYIIQQTKEKGGIETMVASFINAFSSIDPKKQPREYNELCNGIIILYKEYSFIEEKAKLLVKSEIQRSTEFWWIVKERRAELGKIIRKVDKGIKDNFESNYPDFKKYLQSLWVQSKKDKKSIEKYIYDYEFAVKFISDFNFFTFNGVGGLQPIDGNKNIPDGMFADYSECIEHNTKIMQKLMKNWGKVYYKLGEWLDEEDIYNPAWMYNTSWVWYCQGDFIRFYKKNLKRFKKFMSIDMKKLNEVIDSDQVKYLGSAENLQKVYRKYLKFNRIFFGKVYDNFMRNDSDTWGVSGMDETKALFEKMAKEYKETKHG